ncbi:MAG TPA: GHMP kinase [Bacteroidetes bacterium]|nr:GHMP kinase [Bacteroidota bacterium]
MKNKWFANGKLLITGEYLVLHGAEALAVPLKYGQSLTVQKNKSGLLQWQANAPGGLWFTAVFKLPSLEVLETSDSDMSEQLRSLLLNVKKQAENFLTNEQGLTATTNLDFDPDYGFGSSSTLVYCVARWAKADPYVLQQETFGGSGYDIACADADGPVTFQRTGNNRNVSRIDFSPLFKDQLYFVYLGRKQQTAGSIKSFQKEAVFEKADIQKITDITREIPKTKKLEDFEALLNEHEQIMSSVLRQPVVKELYFSEYQGAVKSLGAWGGDFVLVTSRMSREEFIRQMHNQRFDIIYPFAGLVL